MYMLAFGIRPDKGKQMERTILHTIRSCITLCIIGMIAIGVGP